MRKLVVAVSTISVLGFSTLGFAHETGKAHAHAKKAKGNPDGGTDEKAVKPSKARTDSTAKPVGKAKTPPETK